MRKLHNPRVFAMARLGALPVPANHDVCAFTKSNVFDRWADEAAGVRAVETGDNIISMFDVIGQDYWSGGGITAKSVTAQLRAIGDRPVEVQINSPGGDMFEGIAGGHRQDHGYGGVGGLHHCYGWGSCRDRSRLLPHDP